MLSKVLNRNLGRLVPRFNMNHIKNMEQQYIKNEMYKLQNKDPIQFTDRIYKPTTTIQFDREGEVLLYSAQPLINETIYFPYPAIFYQFGYMALLLNYFINPFDFGWVFINLGVYMGIFSLTPRLWGYHDLKFTPRRITLLRGGRVLRFDVQTIGNLYMTYWSQTYQCKPLTEDKLHFADRDTADFLNEDGQLKYDLNVQFQDLKLEGVNLNDQQVYLKKYGIVHHPQLFEAAMKGFNIDTTDFVINTADNRRHREGIYNQ